MTQQIILGRISGLSISSGLSLGTGLTFGGGFSGIIFSGGGGMTVSTIQHGLSQVTLNGGGTLSALPSGRYLTNPVAFHGSGTAADGNTLSLSASAKFSGTGSLTP